MPPLGAVGGVRGAGRLRETVEPSAQPERLINMKVTEGTAAFLLQPLPGEHPQQRTRGWDQARAGLIRWGHAWVQSAAGSQRQEEKNTCDPRAPAAARRPRDTTHIRPACMVWADDSGAVVPPGRATTPRGHETGGP